MLIGAINRAAVAEAVLLRLSGERGGPLGTARLARDLEPLVAHRLSATQWRHTLGQTLMGLASDGTLNLSASRLEPTAKSWRRRDELLGHRVPSDARWPELRDVHLIASALGVAREPRRWACLATNGGLRRTVLECAFGIRIKDTNGLTTVRDTLARLALRRGTVTGDAAVNSASLSARDRRAQAATLLLRDATPRTDQQLIAEIAAEQAGAKGTTPADLRLQLLRRYLAGEGFTAVAVPKPPQKPFDLMEFLAEVRNFAREVAQGWHGNRRALISRVFPALAGAHPEWGLDVERFKALLAEAHRAGRLHLVNADLRDRSILNELQASAIAYHNMIMHFIRVEDEASDAA